MMYNVLSSALAVLAIIKSARAATPNADSKYRLWPNPDKILYHTVPEFDQLDYQMLQAAMNQITIDSAQCIKFQRYNRASDAGKDYLYISNTLSGGKSMPSCYTFAGRVDDQRGTGQYMVLFSSRSASNGSMNTVVPGACLDNLRDAMRPLFQALGFRNEYSRTDRVNFLDFTDPVNPNSLVAASLKDSNPFRLVQPGEASLYNVFDSLSITMVDGHKWGSSFINPVFTPKSGVWIGGKPNLSQQDCQALSMYNCDTLKCQNPYLLLGNGGLQLTTPKNPVDAYQVCFPGQRITLATVTASGLSADVSMSAGVASGVAFGQPQMEFGPMQPSTGGVNSNSPYAFSIIGANPQNFQILPDAKNPSKANVILSSAARSFTNAQITVQVSSQINKNIYMQMILAMNLNCAPYFPLYPPGSSGSTAENRMKYPTAPITGVACDGNLLTTPVIIGAFSATDPDNEMLTFYLTGKEWSKFQVSSSGVLIATQAPTTDTATMLVNVNAMDANGAVNTLYLSVAFTC